MPRIIFITIALLLWNSIELMARKRYPDAGYVRTFPRTVTVRTFLGEKISTFTLIDKATNRRLAYHPNNVLALGIGATIRGLGLNVSVGLPFHDQKEDVYGVTRHIDLQVHRYSRKLMIDAYYQNYKGFHLSSKDDVTMIPGPEEYPYFPNIRALTIGASGLYVFNGERYSLRTVSTQQEWQMRSAGSPLLGASIFTHLFSNDKDLLPQYYKYPDFLGGHEPRDIHYYGLNINAGYGYTWVLDNASHYFLAGAIDGGAGPGYSSAEEENGTRLNHMTVSFTANVRLGAGYNSEKWFAGIYGIYHTDRYPLPYENTALSTGQGLVRLVLARRIPTRKSYLYKQQ
jgi:hypothetical protein